MPKERSSSFSSSNFCFWPSFRTLYESRWVSCGVSTSNWVSWLRRPLTRICGYVPLVMCKYDAPRSTMSCRRSAILAAIVPPYHRKCPALRQGNSQHFLDRRSSFNDLHEPSLPQRPHTRRLGDRPQLGGPLVLEDGVAELLADRHDLVDRDAPLHSREVTGRAALALVELHLPLPGRDVSILDEAFLVGVVGLPALFAYLPSQSLGQDEQQRRRHQERRNPHVEESRDRRGAIVGVQGGEDQMAGE